MNTMFFLTNRAPISAMLLGGLLLTGCVTLNPDGMVASPSREIPAGIKEALIQGIDRGAASASAVDGFLKNDRIKIPLPPDARRVERTLRQMGLGSQVDKAVLTMNRAAEQAAAEAKPIFAQAIRRMTIQDAVAIVNGDQHAATSYLRNATNDELMERFLPIVDNALSKTDATRIYGDLARAFNAVPLTGRSIDPNLNRYVTGKALDGLFHLVAEEEARIRADPLARTTALMRRVFADQPSP
ncbi:MAG TPA: DUF4197 domain-containing protein [Kiritimatiellia bacterium]|nr:DUF4197 domain-containing protein [Kiritimatiellia bacterium]HMP00295.1 DUF4197 domain-containing protein [Kiritimatiellia bacterium]HMP97636.1 DUF4197 domain-containing protein [Kiritimatiellia bacterium]